jgi:Uma2 family endonuclease
MAASLRWTSADLEAFPQPLDDTRYEIIDGELYVTTQPSLRHQFTSGEIYRQLQSWSLDTDAGLAIPAPGLIFAGDDNVAPDVVWIRKGRLAGILGDDGKLHGPPDLIVEVLSPGATNAQRDKDVKLKLYSRRGVREYWIANWEQRLVEIYRREGDALRLMSTRHAQDALDSPLLPGFSCRVGHLFLTLPPESPDR